MSKLNKNAAVIGSGFGGLAMAIRLQVLGFNTTIYEKNSQVGGHASQLKLGNYTFDMGPSIITEPKLIHELYELAGKPIPSTLNFIRLHPYYRVYYHDKTFIDYSSDETDMKKQLMHFNETDAKSYDSFMKFSKKLYEVVIIDGLGGQPFVTLNSFVKFLPKAFSLAAILPGYFVVSRFFKDFRTRFLFSFHPLFLGGNPFKTPSLFLMLPYLEKYSGVWFAKGGMYTVVNELAELFISLGGQIKLNSPVQELIINNDKVASIKVDNVDIPIDLVVSNAHYAHTYKDLISETHRKVHTNSKIISKKYSMSCVLLYIGVKKKYEQLLHHTLILSPRYKELINDIFDKKNLPEDFSMYVHAPSKTDLELAPEYGESIYVLVPVPNQLSKIDWDMQKDKFTKRILDYLEHDFGLTDLQSSIEEIQTFTPKDFELQRNNYLGACWSLQPMLTQIANFRPHNRSEEFSNLYLVGASTHPGAGVPGVILSAKATEQLIKQDFQL